MPVDYTGMPSLVDSRGGGLNDPFPSLSAQFPGYGNGGGGGGGGGGAWGADDRGYDGYQDWTGGGSGGDGYYGNEYPARTQSQSAAHGQTPWGPVVGFPGATPFPEQRQLSPWNTPAAGYATVPIVDERPDWTGLPSEFDYGQTPQSTPGLSRRPTSASGKPLQWQQSPGPSLFRSLSSVGTGPRAHYKSPEDWRGDFRKQQPGLSRLLSFKRTKDSSLTRNVLAFMGVTQLHETLLHKTPPVVFWDLRTDPTALKRRGNPRPYPLEQQESATNPAAQFMRLFHPLLPWYITVEAPNDKIITISHLLWQIHFELRRPISDADYYNDRFDQADRERIYNAWVRRCQGDQDEALNGVRRVDFLGEQVVFEGLKKKEEMWEIKTGRLKG